MQSASQRLEQRYAINLSASWTRWWEDDVDTIRPAGPMNQTVSVDQLCEDVPEIIWPGFMLPDSLPILGNEYGDWICARVTSDGSIGELFYWYHGGGDWIPVGTRMAECLLHDAIDQIRPQRKLSLRAAGESRTHFQTPWQALQSTSFRQWLREELDDRDGNGVDCVLNHVAEGHTAEYQACLQLMLERGWASDAVTCDLIEFNLQRPVDAIASAEVAERVGMAWYPDYGQLLFDVGRIAETQRQQILQAAELLPEAWPTQNWDVAGQLAKSVVDRRQDLGWANSVLGWSFQRQQNLDAAVATYWNGRFASSFADQSLRLGSHCWSENLSKFGTEQLVFHLLDHLSDAQLSDPYFSIFAGQQTRSLQAEVHDYWWSVGSDLMGRGQYPDAYSAFYNAGWDLGVSRLSDYQPILLALSEAAKLAGWTARAAVAKTHLRVLQSRMR